MKKHLSSILFGLLGLCAGMAICYIYFVLPQPNTAGRQPPVPRLVLRAVPATLSTPAKGNGDAVALAKELDTLLNWQGDSWQQPEAATRPSDSGKNLLLPHFRVVPPTAAGNPNWRNFAIPMPQPPENALPNDWQPQLILPMNPPKIYGQPGAIAENWEPKLIVPTIPPKILDHSFPEAR